MTFSRPAKSTASWKASGTRSGPYGLFLPTTRLAPACTTSPTFSIRSSPFAASGGTVLAEVETGLVVEGHPDKLAVVVDNLLANAAVHAAGAGVMVKATQLALPEGQIVEIVVSDQGPGLPAVDQEHAFERGWRGPGTGKLPGSGLGLYQCRQLVEAEGGSISLVGPAPTGRPTNRGLTALVRIPLRQTLSLSLAGAKSESPIL